MEVSYAPSVLERLGPKNVVGSRLYAGLRRKRRWLHVSTDVSVNLNEMFVKPVGSVKFGPVTVVPFQVNVPMPVNVFEIVSPLCSPYANLEVML